MARNFKDLVARMDPERRARVEKRTQEELRRMGQRVVQSTEQRKRAASIKSSSRSVTGPRRKG